MLRRKAIASLSLSLSLETNRIERIIKRLNGANGSLSLSLFRIFPLLPRVIYFRVTGR